MQQKNFEIKQEAKEEGNKGLEAIAKMCINWPTGKWGNNPEKQREQGWWRSVKSFTVICVDPGTDVSINVITDSNSIGWRKQCIHRTQPVQHVYISAFITSYACLKLYNKASDPIKHLVLYFNTDSVIYVSPTGEHLIPVDYTGEIYGYADIWSRQWRL